MNDSAVARVFVVDDDECIRAAVCAILKRAKYDCLCFPDVASCLEELKAQNRVLVSSGERMAINMPIQGTAADIIKIAMVRLQKTMRERKLRSKMILQVHDELVFECEPHELDALKPLVKDLMETALPMIIPVKVDLKAGKNWDEMA